MSVSGLLLVDKSRGPTSHDVVRDVRRAHKTREVGHAGTLDPMATGLLVVLLGEATRLVPWATGADKTYEAELRLGEETDSLDAMGAVVREAPVPADLATRLDDALRDERARTEQIPPAVSAIHVDGERAHDRVRRGEEVVLPPRPVHVTALTAELVDARTLRLELSCGKGYYVRALARDLAARLGTVGHLVALRRTKVGPFRVEDAGPTVHATADAMRRLFPCVEVGEDVALRFRQGKRVLREALGEVTPGTFGALAGGVPLAIVEVGDEEARVVRGFPERPIPSDSR